MSRSTHPEVYAGVPVLVLGASGFLGRWVARALTSAGASLHLAVREPRAAGAVFEQFRVRGVLHVTNLADPGETDRLVREVAPAIAFNLAGYGVDPAEKAAADPELAFRLNRDLVRVLGEALLAVGARDWPFQRLVHAGSALEYGRKADDLRETSVPDPTTLYGRSKLGGTTALRDLAQVAQLRAVTARLFTVYGPGEHPGRLLPSLYCAGRDGTTLQLTAGTQLRDFTYVEDVAEGLLRLGVAPCLPGEVANLATGKLLSVKDFALTAARILHMGREQLAFGVLPTRPEEMAHEPVNVARLVELTEWHPRTEVAEGIRRAVEHRYFQAH